MRSKIFLYQFDDDDYEEIPITLRLKKDIAQVGRLIAKHCDEGFDQLIPISDELKQNIQKLLSEEEKEEKSK